MPVRWNLFCTLPFLAYYFVSILFCHPCIMLLFFYTWFCAFNWLSCEFLCCSFVFKFLKFVEAFWTCSDFLRGSSNTHFSLLFKLSLFLKTRASQLIRNKIIHFLLCLKENMTDFFYTYELAENQCIRIQSFLLVRSLALLSQPCLCSCSAVLYLFSLLFEFVLIQLSFFFL